MATVLRLATSGTLDRLRGSNIFVSDVYNPWSASPRPSEGQRSRILYDSHHCSKSCRLWHFSSLMSIIIKTSHVHGRPCCLVVRRSNHQSNLMPTTASPDYTDLPAAGATTSLPCSFVFWESHQYNWTTNVTIPWSLGFDEYLIRGWFEGPPHKAGGIL